MAWAPGGGAPSRPKPSSASSGGSGASSSGAAERDGGDQSTLGADFYAAGLARFNLARTSQRTGDPSAARQAVVEAVHMLEQAADRYETIGQRERAFDCFQVLIAIGKESAEFEHVLEGYVNVIRILREDHLRYCALQSYEEVVAAAEARGEASAAATLAREMGAYARKEGLPSVANFATLTQARLWQNVASAAQGRRSPAEIAENALLAAVIAYGEAGQYQRVGSIYKALSELPLEAARCAHYARARTRYVDAQDLAIDAGPLPAHLRQEVGFPEVWHVDLVEWEQRGSASQACGDVVLDPAQWSDVTRRRAMLARLAKGEATVTELAEPFAMSMPAISKHLKVLERAGLIERGREAQWRPARLQPEPLREVNEWMEPYRRFWEESFDRLDEYLRTLQSGEQSNDNASK